jgi:hypothetical protein
MARRQRTEDQTTDAPAKDEAPKSTALTNWASNAGALALSDEEMAAALKQTAAEHSTGGGGDTTFLSFSGKSGRWSLGQERLDRSDDWLFVVDPQQCRAGWTCWVKSKAVGKHSWSVFRPDQAVPFGSLDDHGPYDDGDGWVPMVSIGMLAFFTEISDGAAQVTLETNSRSGRGTLSDLQNLIGDKFAARDPKRYPLVELSEEMWESREGHRNYKPVFNVIDWLTAEQVQAAIDDPSTLEEEDEAPAPPPPPTARRGRRQAA